jgi:hypothetical protein
MVKIKGGLKKKKTLTYFVTMMLVVSTLFLTVFINVPKVDAGQVDHDVGNVGLTYLTDFGRILRPFMWSQPQTVQHSNGFGYIGLVIDQDNYDHTPGQEEVADGFYTSWPYAQADDLITTLPISMIIDDATLQKSFASFQNEGVSTGDPFDIHVNQTAWTVVNKDFALIQWTLKNVRSPAATLNNVCIGLEIPFSKDGSRFGVGGTINDGGDDIDGFDATEDVYWVQDIDSGITIGVGSAIVSDPITHYYGEDYHSDYTSEYMYFFGDDAWLYNRLHAPNTLATDGVNPGNITTTVGWDGITLAPGESRTLTYAIAINNTYSNMISAIKDAQNYYHTKATRFQLTEFMDSGSGSAKIEVFNFGKPPTAVSELSLSADVGPLTGTWDVDPVPTYGYSVFTVNENIDTQGDTIVLLENSVPVDSVSFGQKGPAADPLDGESTARYYDPSIIGYSDTWIRNASSGPDFGFQNNVGWASSDPGLVINEVMFNPSAIDGSFIELLNSHPLSAINLRNFQLVCNDLFQFSDTDLWLDPGEKLMITYANAPTFFTNMISSGDNIYMYNNNDILYDMMGWSSAHLVGMSALRVPDGFGTYQGYDDTSSENAGWVFNTPNKVLITEISDSESSPSQVEIYNPKYPFIDFDVGFTLSSTSSGSLAGVWSIPITNSGDYALFDISTPLGLAVEGDTLGLYQNGYLVEEFSYGTKGTVPDPLPGESVQRILAGSTYLDIFERNWFTGPNFGLQNDVPLANLSTAIVLNEVLFNPSDPANYFVELYHRFIMPVDISGFKIVGDSEFVVPPGTVLSDNKSFYYLQYSQDPTFFDPNLDPQGDNVYLYDSNGSLMDMVGWSSQHTIDKSVCRVPDGNGTPDGYDDTTSVLAEWQFDCEPTLTLITVDVPKDDKTAMFGDFGDWVYFNLTIWNAQTISDIISLTNTTVQGWLVEILDETGTFVITDVTLGPDELKNIKVRVKIPDTFNFIVQDNVTITIQSSNIDVIRDTILLKAKLYPFVKLDKSADPTLIYVEGTGQDEETTITLSALGTGAIMEGEISNAADIVFVVDDTGSMDPYLNSIKNEIQNIVDVFLDEIVSVRLGLVSYKDAPEVEWDCRLTFNVTNFTIAVNNLFANGGGDIPEDVRGALNLAYGANWRNGSVTKIVIVIGDAPDHDNPPGQIYIDVNDAYVDVWGIYTNAIACGPSGPTIDMFQRIAENGSGIFFNYQGFMDPEALAQVIIDSVLTFVPKVDTAARDLDIVDANPMIRDVLPPYIHYVPGSASIPPDIIYVDASGNTILEWNVTNIKIGENWTVSFNVTSSQLDWQLANVVSESRISYTMWNSSNVTEYFPEVWINVTSVPKPPEPPLPPNPKISVIAGTNDIRLEWAPPISPDLNHYLIYRTLDEPNNFEFSTPWINTSLDSDPIGLDIFGLRTTWNFTDDVISAQEVYYCIIAVNNYMQKSTSSYSVGKWTKMFSAGLSSFSIPLEVQDVMTADDYLLDMGADYIRWMNSSTGFWMKHGDGEVNDIQLRQGEGYEVNFTNPANYTFCGMPASSIIYNDSSFAGFDFNSEARDLWASVNAQGNVFLSWNRSSAMDLDDSYLVYRTTDRRGFHDDSAQLMATISFGNEIWTDLSAAQSGTHFYYMIVPENDLGERGTSTYSIGVWTEEYLAGYDTIGIPVKMDDGNTLDWYCDNIIDSVGINYLIQIEGRWGWHSTSMPEGAFDTQLMITHGYQISTTGPTQFTFVGI